MKQLILGTMILCGSLAALAIPKNDGETRSATIKTDISAMDVINIQAKYTDLVIETWDKDEVLVEASIRYDGKMTDKIQSFLDQFEELVEENIKYGSGELKIDTGVDFPNRGVKKSFFGLVVEINMDDYDEAKLEYRIKAPPSNKYVINTSYRDAKLIGNFSEIALTQYSGELEADNIAKAELNLKYGSATFKDLGQVDMEIYEQEIESGKINMLKLNAKYSDLEISEVGMFEATSYESDYKIGSIQMLTGNFKYGEMEITQEIETAKLTLYEEDIEARKIGTLTLENSKYSKLEVARIESIKLEESYEDEFTIGALGSLISENSKYGKYEIDQLQGSFKLNGYEDEIAIDDIAISASEITIDGKYINASIGAEDVSFSLTSKIKYGKIDYNEDNIEIRKYIKDNDQLEIEVYSKQNSEKKLLISINGYEIDINID